MEEETKKKALRSFGEQLWMLIWRGLLISLKVILINQTRAFVLILLHHKGVVLILEQSALIVEVLAICLFNVLQN